MKKAWISVVAAVAVSASFAHAQPTATGSPLRLEGVSSSVLPGDSPSVVFLNTYTGAGYWTYPRGQWVRVNLKPFGVPADATAAILHGMLIISMGSAPDFGLISVHFRRPGTITDCANTPIYTEVTGQSWGGMRTPFSDIVPLANGEVDVCVRTLWGSPSNAIAPHPWEASFSGYPAFGVNVRLRGWLR
jgi:hypothetical protein